MFEWQLEIEMGRGGGAQTGVMIDLLVGETLNRKYVEGILDMTKK